MHLPRGHRLPGGIQEASGSLINETRQTITRKLCGIKKGLVGYLVAMGGRDKEEIYRRLYRSVHQIKISRGEKSVRPGSILTEEKAEKLIGEPTHGLPSSSGFYPRLAVGSLNW